MNTSSKKAWIRAWRLALAAAGLGLSSLARAFVQIPSQLAPGLAASLGAGLSGLGGALVVAGAAALGYQLLHAGEGAARQVLLSRQAPGGRLARRAVDVGGPHGEDVAGLAAAEGLPRPGVSAPLAGVSGPARASTPARPASGPSATSATAATAATARDTRYLQALALSTMVRIDDRPDASAGWPVVSYCRAGVHALQCHHGDVWIRNRSSVDLRDVSICVAPEAKGYFEIAGAGSDGCLHAELAAHADRQIDVEQTPTRHADYPGFANLELDLSQDAWHAGLVLHRLWLPVMRPQTFFPLRKPGAKNAQDEQHAIGVQARRVNLLQQLVVYTYHGSGESVAQVRSVELDDAHKGFRLVPRASQPAPFEKYRVPECTARAQPGPGQVHRLDSGMSCALLVSATDIHQAPYVAAGTVVQRDEHAVTRHEKPPLAAYAKQLEPDQARAFRASLDAYFRLFHSQAPGAVTASRMPLVMRLLMVAGGDFNAFGTLGRFEYPAPHLVYLGGDSMTLPANLLLAPHNRVDAISPSPSGRRLFIGGLLHPLVPMSVEPAVSMLGVDEGDDWYFWNRHNGPDGPVHALVAAGGRLYVGGAFQRVANSSAPGIVAMRVSPGASFALRSHTWEHLSHGLSLRWAGEPPRSGVVRAILPMPDGRMVLGGSFGTHPDGQQLSEGLVLPETLGANVILWNPQTREWNPAGVLLGGGNGPYQSWVSALCAYQSRVYAGGRFDWVSEARQRGPQLRRVSGWARLRLSRVPHWNAVTRAVDSLVRSCVTTPEGLVVGGRFDDPLNHTRRVLLRWDGYALAGLDEPMAIAPGDDAYVDALGRIGSRIFIGGRFSELSDGTAAANLARYDSDTGRVSRIARMGVNGPVRAFAPIWELRAGVGD